MSKDKKVQDELQSLDQQIGQRLRYFRQLSGISQRDLGARIGCSFQQVQKYESGKNRISAPRLVMVSRALGVSSEVLVASGQQAAESKDAFENPLLKDIASLPPKKQKIVQKLISVLKEL